ncbi:MAG: transcription termination factor Rho, partial [Phycisphaerales bacterium]|nr:transcription termination factor Rho [Phycisphaerales bacterium]
PSSSIPDSPVNDQSPPPPHPHPQGGGQPHQPGKRKRRRRRRGKGNQGVPGQHQHPPHPHHTNAGRRQGPQPDHSGTPNGQAFPPADQQRQQPRHQPQPAQRHYPVQIAGFDAHTAPRIKPFEDLTSIDPRPRLTLEYRGCPDDCRLIDLFCPIGRGQRALIVSPPKAGKTTLLKDISTAVVQNHRDVTVIALLIDERPEEVTDFRRTYASFGNHDDGTPRAQVLASSNDHNVQQHTALAIGTMEIAKRMVEAGRHVVIVLDSITRLARAFNNNRKYANSGRTMSGGIDAKAMEVPRQIFGSARNSEEAGSLTIIATCLVDTGSQMDQVIFEEFKGSGNMELILDRKIAERRIFPAINLAASGTRKEDLLLSAQELKTMTALRRRLIAMPPHTQAEQLVAALKRFPDNATLVGSAG